MKSLYLEAGTMNIPRQSLSALSPLFARQYGIAHDTSHATSSNNFAAVQDHCFTSCPGSSELRAWGQKPGDPCDHDWRLRLVVLPNTPTATSLVRLDSLIEEYQ